MLTGSSTGASLTKSSSPFHMAEHAMHPLMHRQ
jgi:hypothetical protein